MRTEKPEDPAGSLPAVMRTPWTGLLAITGENAEQGERRPEKPRTVDQRSQWHRDPAPPGSKRSSAPAAFAAALAAGVIVLTGCTAAPATHPARTAPASALPSRPPAASPGGWGAAQAVPGTAALNQGGQADAMSVSCASAGNCTAGGHYLDGSGHAQAFVASEVNGTWQQAEEVPGLAALGPGGSEISSVSCASAGNCSAVGIGGAGTFAVSQAHGTWQQAKVVPRITYLSSVSCASAGNCGAGGSYADGSGHAQAFVASEVNGTWQQAGEVPGTAALNKNGQATVASVSCASARDCSAAGDYEDSSGGKQVFVASEVNGTWGQAEEVPGTAALNQDGNAKASSVSCASAGNCVAGGYYGGDSSQPVFVVSEVHGAWQQAEEVPGAAALAPRGFVGQLHSVSCAPEGGCSAVGYYSDGLSARSDAFVASKT